MNKIIKINRPPLKGKKYKKVSEMASSIQDYFQQCTDKMKPLTVAGLAFHLGFLDTQSLCDYESKPGYDQFHILIKRAKLYILTDKEERLISGKGNVAGLIFDLKNNYGYADKQEIKFNSKNISLLKGFEFELPNDSQD